MDKIQEEIIEEFSVFDDWLDKYDYLIGLSDSLPAIPAEHRTEQYLIEGCQSRVWVDARMEQGALVFPNGERFTRDSWAQIPDGPVKVSVRPEEFVVHHADEKVEGISAVLEDSVYLGLNTHYYLKLSSGASVELIQESTIDEKLEPGSTVTLTLKNEKINIFSEDGAKNYLRG